MVSFQQDYLLIINKEHENYISKIQTLFENKELINSTTLENAEKLIEYLKDYKYLINSICKIIDKINNLGKLNDLNDKIEQELMVKMLPIIEIYRILLNEKYKTNSINDQD